MFNVAVDAVSTTHAKSGLGSSRQLQRFDVRTVALYVVCQCVASEDMIVGEGILAVQVGIIAVEAYRDRYDTCGPVCVRQGDIERQYPNA